jgi:hypothetical protein
MNEDRGARVRELEAGRKAYQTSIKKIDEDPGNHDVRSWPRGTVILLISDLLSTAIKKKI